MYQVKDVMTRAVQTIEPDGTLAQAAARMDELGIGALPVRDSERLVGMITDRDITVRATAEGLDPGSARVRQVMTDGVAYCFLDQTVREAAALMEKYGVRRLPVLNRENHLVGIVSLDDLAVDTGDTELAGEVLEAVAQQPRAETPTYRHILVALDGSELAEQVLPYVEPLAERFGSTVTLLRAVTPIDGLIVSDDEARHPVQSDERSITAVVPISEETRWHPVRYVTVIQERLQSKGITVDSEYPEGQAGSAIVQRARHMRADLIAMTTHGRGGLSRAVHGSVTDEVLRNAPCAVLLVRAHEGW